MPSRVNLASVARWDEGDPVIHGPEIYGASITTPFLYAIPTTGERPIHFHVAGLPDALHLDPTSGRITGTARQEGEFRLLLCAENRHGKAEKEFTLVIGGGLALTPPMGWNSWNAWRRWVDDGKVRAAADGLVRTGLAARGYSYVNIDSCWQGRRGGELDAIQPNSKFPDMKALADHIHRLGLKFGIYSTPWVVPWGCDRAFAEAEWGCPGLIGCSSGEPDPAYRITSSNGQYVGVHTHEAQDVAQWEAWGVDFLKYDWTVEPASLERMGRQVRNASRDIVFSICTGAKLEDVETIKTWANMWRGLPDTIDSWASILGIAFIEEDLRMADWRPHVKPGAWNDLDMLALGPQHESAARSRPNRLTESEQITAMTAWALYPSPLILSCDLSTMTDFELRLFANEDVIAVNQDSLGKPAVRLRERREQALHAMQPQHNARIWARSLAGGNVAVGLFNLAERPDVLSVDLGDLGISGSVRVRNLWERRDTERIQDRVSAEVPAHGAQFLLVKP